MTKEKMNILVTFDENYIKPFQTMLKSLVFNNLDYNIKIYLAYQNMDKDLIDKIGAYCNKYKAEFFPIEIDNSFFTGAKVTDRYPNAMYYRLLAPLYLPETLDRILYLDPDTLIINSLKDLWDLDMEGFSFAAAAHSVVAELSESVHKARLEIGHEFFNTGIILMDLVQARDIVNLDEILDMASNLGVEHLYPDQDIFNILYGAHTKEIDDRIWNYEARFYHLYLIRSAKEYDLDWVMENTSILHFSGRNKPWLQGSYNYFTALYKHYMHLELDFK